MSLNQNKLEIFRQNGRLIADIRDQVVQFAQTNHLLEEIDRFAEELIVAAGGEPAFKRVPGYHWATCISVNHAIVHGIPKGSLKDGDLVTIDLGMYYHGTTTDTATTIVIGEATLEQQHFLKVGQKALRKAIKQAQPGNRVQEISAAMQKTVEAAGFNVARTLTGHGLGETMHQEPSIPCFVSADPAHRVKLESGMVLAIEIMYMAGNWPLVQAEDGWTLSTQDLSPSAVFEEDVIVTDSGPEIITSNSTLEQGVEV
jgi:methionyl aminopeptidase